MDLLAGGYPFTPTTKPLDEYPGLAPFFQGLEQLRRDHYDAFRHNARRPIYAMDQAIVGVLKRSIDLLEGFWGAVDKWNIAVAGPLVRLQIDSFLRLFFLAKHPEVASDIVMDVMRGRSFRDISIRVPRPSKPGTRQQALTDAYLCEFARPHFDWLDQAYKDGSGLVHFSDRHIFFPVTEVDGDNRTVTMAMTPGCRHWPEKDIAGMVALFNEVTASLLALIVNYIETKPQ